MSRASHVIIFCRIKCLDFWRWNKIVFGPQKIIVCNISEKDLQLFPGAHKLSIIIISRTVNMHFELIIWYILYIRAVQHVSKYLPSICPNVFHTIVIQNILVNANRYAKVFGLIPFIKKFSVDIGILHVYLFIFLVMKKKI